MSDTHDAEQIIVTHDPATDTYSFRDDALEEIGRKMLDARKRQRAAEREIRALEDEQQRRLQVVSAMDHLHHYPNRQQATVLSTFQLALHQENPLLLKMAHMLCLNSEAQKTNWRTEDGETVDVAFARRIAEFGESA